ncbi:centrosomal protein kizuna isoform X2 [Panthera onca]|uniref:centrosomal protein kizuna isoform X2 n=1 Tax=Panthera onca TaxID=9690 RepID=UPI002955A25B|nr:centrosomal protein kizuna isoform X2 [Panthera onca]
MVGPSPGTTQPPDSPLALQSERGGGGMHPAFSSSAPLASPDYYERLGRLQHGLRDSEKKRLDLEKKLYEYNQSDVCRVKLKYVKLKRYLKEICESEKKARTRNQEYLKRFEHVQAHVGHFTTNTEKLQELKTEYEAQIKKTQLLSKDRPGIKGELKDEDREKVTRQAGTNSGTAMSRGLYQPATIFMGCQMSAISSIGGFSTEQKSPQPTKNFSIPDPHSHRQTAQSGNVTDSYVVQTNSDTQCLNKSDKIDGKTSLQIGEKTPVTASALSEEEQTHCLQIGSNTRHGGSSLSEGKKSAELHSLLRERLSPENRTTDLKCDSCSRSEGSEGEILTQECIEVKEERARPPVSPLSASEYCASVNKCSQEKDSAWEGFPDHLPPGDPESQKPFRKMQEQQEEESLSSSSSDLTVSATALLKKALTEECDDRSAIHSNESSCSLPSILNDNSGIKEAKPTLWLNSVRTREQEVSSGCGDETREESVAAKIPITETKAYQLLKQSTLQDNINHTEDRFQKADVSVIQLSGLNIGSGILKTKTTNKIASEASFSSSEGSPLSRHENEKKLTTNLESKAFWDESDDSNSEIEAALRPRNHNTSADDFGDFYD